MELIKESIKHAQWIDERINWWKNIDSYLLQDLKQQQLAAYYKMKRRINKRLSMLAA